MKNRLLQLCLIPLLFAGWSVVAPAETGDPQQQVRAVTERILGRLESSPGLRENRSDLVRLIEEEIFPLVDFERASRLTLGREWTRASEDQQRRFVDEMRTLLACTYSTAFANYAGQDVEYLPPRWTEDRDQVEVRSRITQSGAPPMPVNYRLHEADGDWRIYDLVVEGVSLVANYRATFRQTLRSQDLDALIADLSERGGRECRREG